MEDLQCGYADITVSPKSLDFAVDEGWSFIPPYQDIRIDRDGTGSGARWEMQVNTEWLRVEPRQGQAPTRVRIGCSSIGMAAGVYEGAITITSHVKIDAPVIPITLTVKPKEEPEPEPEPPEPGPPDPEPEPEPPEPGPPDPEPGPPDPEPGPDWVTRFIAWMERIFDWLFERLGDTWKK